MGATCKPTQLWYYSGGSMQDRTIWLERVLKPHARIGDAGTSAFDKTSLEKLSRIALESEGDTIYAVDEISEELLLAFFEMEVAPAFPLLLVAEGLPGGKVTFPRGIPEEEVNWRVIMDPIDGTRGLMYQKRSAWILTGVAPNLGPRTSLQDIELAVQTEIPLVKQHLSDVIWACCDEGVDGFRYNRLTGERQPLQLQASKAKSISHGFAMIARFFPGTRDTLAAIDEEIVLGALGPVQLGKAHSFEDQYISTGGQLYELMAGHDRFSADLRPLMEKVLARRGQALGICCHPYDICTELIARKLGIRVADVHGDLLDPPLDVETDVTWVGYANDFIRMQIEPLLRKAIKKRKLI